MASRLNLIWYSAQATAQSIISASSLESTVPLVASEQVAKLSLEEEELVKAIINGSLLDELHHYRVVGVRPPNLEGQPYLLLIVPIN